MGRAEKEKDDEEGEEEEKKQKKKTEETHGQGQRRAIRRELPPAVAAGIRSDDEVDYNRPSIYVFLSAPPLSLSLLVFFICSSATSVSQRLSHPPSARLTGRLSRAG